MARSIEAIYDSMVGYKATNSQLDGLTDEGSLNYSSTINQLNSNRRVALWRLWTFISATAIHQLERIFDAHKKEVEEIRKYASAGTTPYLVQKAYEFQYNTASNLIVDSNGVPFYDVVVESERIVKYCTANDLGNEVLLKVAKVVGGAKVALEAPELASLKSYISRVKASGTGTDIQSLNGDILRLRLKLYYDGLYSAAVVRTDVTNAIVQYLDQLEFDGFVGVEALTDAIQKVGGYKDVVIEYLVGVNGNNITTIIDVAAGIQNRRYATKSGYISLDPNSDNVVIELIAQ